MGAWGVLNFENDNALDWLDDLYTHGTQAIEDAVGRPLSVKHGDYLDSFSCNVALAAAEIIASLRGNPSSDFPIEGKEWLGKHTVVISQELIDAAQSAIQRIKSNSELLELWKESDSYDEWLMAVEELERRLN